MASGVIGSKSQLQQANDTIARLTKQLVGTSGTDRQAILTQIKASQDIIDNITNAAKKKTQDAADAKIKKDIAEQQALLDAASIRNQPTTTYSNRIKELEGQLTTPKPENKDVKISTSSNTFGTTFTTSKPPKPVITSSTGGTTGGTTGTKDTGPDMKGLWRENLKTTFQTLTGPDKVQIDNLINLATKYNWTESTFTEALKNTTWWQNTLPSMRQFYLDTHDPRNKSTFAQDLKNQMDLINVGMENLGIAARSIDPVTGKVIDNTKTIQGIAMEAMKNGWSDAQVQEYLATNSEIVFTGGGLIQSHIDTLKQKALAYGVNLDKNQIGIIQRDLLNPSDGKDVNYYTNSIRQQSIDSNPWFAPQLKEGRTLYEVTSNYRNAMSNLLEVAPENITWNDLLNKVVNKEKTAANTFADFTKAVKQDPLWQYTRNAKETYSNMAVDLMKQFGFMG
jgi:hypothetical protein